MGQQYARQDLRIVGSAHPVRLRAPSRAAQLAAKRVIDFTIAGTAILLLAPLLLILIVLVTSNDRGPAFFAQRRIGRGGRPFSCFKFRTMSTAGDDLLREHLARDPAARREWEEQRKLTNDPRVTPLGQFLRKSSLDELPQLLNILRGDMSLVGPRPIVPDEIQRYGDRFAQCFSVRPGLTGLWQVSGRSDCSYAHRVLLDASYVKQWSVAHDLEILVKTVPAVLRQRGSR